MNPGLLIPVALIACLMQTQAEAQTRSLTGSVRDSVTDEPLPGARVTLTGSDITASARDDGSFTLAAVPDTAVVLLVHMIGYRHQQVTVGPRDRAVNIRLARDVFRLEELIATGRATGIERRYAGNAVSTVDAADLADVPAASLEQLLYGKVAGADIQKNSGAPGGGLQVRLRGVTSINTPATPLYVLDGVVVSDIAIPSGLSNITASGGSDQDDPVNRIADLNADDIQSIEILKGASASAIYGSKASNGVVLITTKAGRPGGSRIDISQRFGFSELSHTLGSRTFRSADEAAAVFGESARALFTPGVTFDNERALAGRRALGYETSASVNGGTERTQYYASGLLQNEPGVIANTGFERQSVRLNLDHQLAGQVHLGLKTNLLHTLAQRGITNNDNNSTSFYMVLPATPSFVDLRQHSDGTWPTNPFAPTNPVQTAALMTNDENLWRFIAAGQLSVGLITTQRSSMRLLLNAGADFFNQANTLFFPEELPAPLGGQGFETRGNNLNLNLDANLIHSYSTGEHLTATTSLGIQHERTNLDVTTFARHGSSTDHPGQTLAKTRELGLFLQEEVLLGRRLLLTIGTRGDQSSRNGQPDHLFFYPKAAAAYRLFDDGRTSDGVKLRFAYGESGNQPRYGQKFTPLVDQGTLAGLPGLGVTNRTAAEDLRPEHQREIEAGVDAQLFAGVASLELTGYRKDIDDLILGQPLAGSTGFQGDIRNGGSLRTWGAEALLALSPLHLPQTSWLTRVTIAATRSKVTSLPGGPIGPSLANEVVAEGHSPSVIQVIDTAADPVDTTYIEVNPSFRVSLFNELVHRQFRFAFVLDWQQGGRINNVSKLLYDFSENTRDYADPIPGSNSTIGELRLSGAPPDTAYLESASFLKLREVTLSYELPGSAVRALWGSVRHATVSLSARNLFTITGYSGLDPEVSNFGNTAISRLWDIAPFPPSRSFWLTVVLGL